MLRKAAKVCSPSISFTSMLLTHDRLITEEQESQALADAERLIPGNEEMRSMIAEHGVNMQDLAKWIPRVKSALGLDRNFSKQIAKATDEYNIAVIRDIAENGLTKLPRELRDMVYAHLVPSLVEIGLDLKGNPALRIWPSIGERGPDGP